MEVVAETKSSDVEAKGVAEIVKEACVPEASSPPAPPVEATPGPVKDTDGDVLNGASVSEPTPTTEAATEPTKDVTVAIVEGTTNGTSATTVPDPHGHPPALEGDGSMSVDTASTKQSSSSEGEGFASDATWEERTWKELVRLREDMFWARIGGIRALQG